MNDEWYARGGFISIEEAERIMQALKDRSRCHPLLRGADLWGFDLGHRNIEVVSLDKNQEFL